MKVWNRLIVQSIVLAILGAGLGFFLFPYMPRTMAIELTQTLGSIAAIAGSLLGWSAGWLDRSRTVIKEIDYDAARHLFRKIGKEQTKLICRWGIALAASLLTIICSVVMKTGDLQDLSFRVIGTIAISLLSVSMGTVAYLLQTMLAASRLKEQLEDYEHEELRKLRNRPSAKLPEKEAPVQKI